MITSKTVRRAPRERMGGLGILAAALALMLLTACGGPATLPPTATAVPLLKAPTARPTSTRQASTATPLPPTATSLPPTRTPVPPLTDTPAPPTATPGPPPSVAVLAYHHFGVPESGDYDCPLPVFEEQLQWLQDHGYQSILPPQLVDALHGKATLPPHPIVLTFDDDNGEQYTDAAPLLDKYGYRATFFIDTVTIGKRYYMTAAQLQDLERRGHMIGSHTWDHRDIAILTLPELRDQLDKSENDLNDILGHKPQFISYPFGEYNADDVAELQARGYRGGFRLRGRDPEVVDPAFRIPRQIVPGAWSIKEFAQNIHWMEEP